MNKTFTGPAYTQPEKKTDCSMGGIKQFEPTDRCNGICAASIEQKETVQKIISNEEK